MVVRTWPFCRGCCGRVDSVAAQGPTLRETDTLSLFPPSGEELIKEGLGFYLLSALGPWVCGCVRETGRERAVQIPPPLMLFSVTPVQLGYAILATFSQRHHENSEAECYPLADVVLKRGSAQRCSVSTAGRGSKYCGHNMIYKLQLGGVLQSNLLACVVLVH